MKPDQVNYSQLRAMKAIAAASMRSILRSPSAVVFTLVFPLLFILVFGFIDRQAQKPLVYFDLENGLELDHLQLLLAEPTLELQPSPMSPEVADQLKNGEAHAYVKLIRNRHDSLRYVFEVTLSQAALTQGSAAGAILEKIRLQMNLGHLPEQDQLVQSEQKVFSGKPRKMIDFILPGQLGFSLLSSGVFGTAFVFFNLRQTLVIKRFFATPVSKASIVLGEALSRMLFSLGGAAFLITVGWLFLGFELSHGLSTFFAMMGLSALGLLVFMGFGFTVSGLARSESLIPPLANIITLPQFLLSGTFFPIENFPSWLQPICKVLPLTYLNEALRKVATGAPPDFSLMTDIAVVLIWGVLIYSLAVRTFRWD